MLLYGVVATGVAAVSCAAVLIRLADAPALDAALFADCRAAVATEFPKARAVEVGGAASTDDALALVQACLPGWTIDLHGKALAPDGHWRCTLRESSSRDNDAFIGVGQGPSVGQSLLIALLRLVKSGARARA